MSRAATPQVLDNSDETVATDHGESAAGNLIARDLIVIGASAGGVEALTTIIRSLPADLPAAVFVVLHMPRHGTSVLPAILTRRGNLPARTPADGEAIEHGVVYVAPPDQHLVIEGNRVRVTQGPSENGHRPAVDPLFRSAARAGQERVIGVVLSGMLDDGTAGLGVIERLGGTIVVQDPEDALFAGMPTSALENVRVDYVAPASEIGALLARLTMTPIARRTGGGGEEGNVLQQETSLNPEQAARTDASLNEEVDTALMKPDALDGEHRPGFTPSNYACPECGGVLWEVKSEKMIRFRCRTGHAYSPDSLLAVQADALEAALWTAFRALEESASLARRLRERAAQRGHRIAEARFAEQAEECTQRAEVIRQVLLQSGTSDTESLNIAVGTGAEGTLPQFKSHASVPPLN